MLEQLAAELAAAGIRHVLYRDPDPPFNGSPSVLGVEPQPRSKALKRVLGRLAMLKGECTCPRST